MGILDLLGIAGVLLVAFPGGSLVAGWLAVRAGLHPVTGQPAGHGSGTAAEPYADGGVLAAEEAGIRVRQRSAWIGVAGGVVGPFVLGIGQTCGVMISVLALPLVVLLATTVPVYVRQSVSDLRRSEIAAARVSFRIGLAVGLGINLFVWGTWCMIVAPGAPL